MLFPRYVKLALVPTAIFATWTAMAHSNQPEQQSITLRFSAKVGNQPFACGTTYDLGQPASAVTPNDFRFYISDVALLDAKGNATPVNLDQDGKWQYKTVALLDFENKAGACTNGTSEIRDRMTGTIPKGNYTGLKFTLGVPFDLNHSDATLAPSPLNLTGLWWNWQLGYKFLRLDLQKPAMSASPTPNSSHHPSAKPHSANGKHTEASSGFPIHLGSTGCAAEPPAQQPTPCRYPNKTTVTFPRFNGAQNSVVADLARLVANANLTQNQPKTAPGCMSEPEDKDCLSIMNSLGLPFMEQPPAAQSFFSLE